MRMVKLLKLIKLMRVFRLGRMLGKFQERYQIKHGTIMIAKFGALILFAAHWLGCIYFFLTRIQPDDSTGKTWLTEYLSDVGRPIGDRSNLDKYVASLYWALTTMSTIGYGDIIPKTNLERILTMFCMLFGAFLFAYGLTNVCTLLFNHDLYSVEFEGATDELSEFLDRHMVPVPLMQKISSFQWFRHQSSQIEDQPEKDTHLLRTLSPQLRDQVLLSMHEANFNHSKLVARSPTLLWGQKMRIELANHLKGEVIPPDEVIRGGDSRRDDRYLAADRICYVTNGVVSAVEFDEAGNANVLEPLLPGSSFGEREVFCGVKWKEVMGIKAVQHSDIYSIRGEEMRDVYMSFPVERAAVLKVLFGRDKDYILAAENRDLGLEIKEVADGLIQMDEAAFDAAIAEIEGRQYDNTEGGSGDVTKEEAAVMKEIEATEAHLQQLNERLAAVIAERDAGTASPRVVSSPH